MQYPTVMEHHAFDNGDRMPRLGLGTWKSEPGEVGRAVREALAAGYRHVDCAPIYGNEAEVGEAFEAAFDAGDVARDDLWVTSKLWCDAHQPEHVIPALETTLEDLRLDYLDLYLVHWPVAFRHGLDRPRSADDFFTLEELPHEVTWAKMEEAVERGLCRHVGVSNFSPDAVSSLLDAGEIGPEVLQVELHPYLQQDELLAFCRTAGIFVTAYSPLGSPDRPESMKGKSEPTLLDNPTIAEVAEKHDATPAQVLIRWAMERGTSVIPKSVNAERIRENLAAADLRLDDEDMERIAGLDRHFRYVDGEFWEKSGAPYTADQIFGDSVFGDSVFGD